MSVETYTMNDGYEIPAIGLGTYPMDDDEATTAVRSGLEAGYRLIDTASAYGNEAGVGEGIATSGVPREDVVVTTKLRGHDQGYESAMRGFSESRSRLGLEYVDLLLIHWPLPRIDRYVDTWRAMITLRDDGLVRSVGVSNFTAEHLDRIVTETGVEPAVNQIELHPYCAQTAMRAADAERGVLTQAWSPLGRKTDLLADPAVVAIADAHQVTPAQVVLRWHVQRRTIPIPKSSDPQRQRANLDVFSFTLSEGEMARIADRPQHRVGGDPEVHEEF